VNKGELVEQVADRAGLGRGDAAGAVEAALEAIERELAAVSITGFGKFSVAERGPRQARNPQTGAQIEVPAGRAPRFSASAKLKQAVAG
jgi:DNA-binding protein HU-beta